MTVWSVAAVLVAATLALTPQASARTPVCRFGAGTRVIARDAAVVAGVRRTSAQWSVYGCLRATGTVRRLLNLSRSSSDSYSARHVALAGSALAVEVYGRLFGDHPYTSDRLYAFDVSGSSRPLASVMPCPRAESDSDNADDLGGDPDCAISQLTVNRSDHVAWVQSDTLALDPGPSALACADAQLCVAEDNAGHVMETTDPGAGAAGWQMAQVFGPPAGGTDGPAGALACGSPQLCLAMDAAEPFGADQLGVGTTTSPAQWTTQPATGLVADGAPASLVCPSAALCVAGGQSLWASADPAAGTAGFSQVAALPKDDGLFLTPVCPSPSLCLVLAGGQGLRVLSSPTPAQAGSWTLLNAPGLPAPGDLACPAVDLCVAYADNGNLETSTNPTSAASWSDGKVDESNNHDQVDLYCYSSALCLMTDASGNVLVSTNPAGGAATWRKFAAEPSSFNIHPLLPVCASVNLCLLFGPDSGSLNVSTTPGAGGWTRDGLPDTPRYVACPSSAACVALTADGHLMTTDDPAGPGSGWHEEALDVPPCGTAAGHNCVRDYLYSVTSGAVATVDATSAGTLATIGRVRLATSGGRLTWTDGGSARSATLH